MIFCTYEHLSPDGGEHYIVSFPFVENEYYYDILLGFGDKCECLEPPHVRMEIKHRIRDMAAFTKIDTWENGQIHTAGAAYKPAAVGSARIIVLFSYTPYDSLKAHSLQSHTSVARPS